MAPSQAVLELLVQLKDETSANASSIGSALGSLGSIAGGIALGGFAALGGAIISGIGDAREAAQVMAQTEAVINSTGKAAGFTADEIAAMAGSMSAASGKSLFGDDDIQKGQNLLLTFTNIKETLPGATQTMLDMAQALGTDASGSAIQLGKALNDPVEGISALTKVGVTFTTEQKEMIAAMQGAGNMAGAQQVILAELNKEFGGSAEAAAKADGGVAQFWDRIGEAKETLGNAVLPLLTTFVGVLNDDILPLVEQGAALFGTLVGNLSATGDSAGSLTDMLEPLQPIFSNIQSAASEVFSTLTTAGKPILDDLGKIAMPALAAGGKILAGLWSDVLQPALLATWAILKDIVIPGIALLVHWLSERLPPVIAIVADFLTTKLFPALHTFYDFVRVNIVPTLVTLAETVGTNVPRGIEVVVGAWNGLKTALGDFKVGYIDPIVRGWNEIISAIQSANDWFNTIGQSIGSIQIPDWLQGHSPPPLANWFSDIAGAATDAQTATGDIGLGADVGALPSLPGAGGGAGGNAPISITVIVQGSVTTEQDLVTKIRDGLVDIGRRNIDIFGGAV